MSEATTRYQNLNGEDRVRRDASSGSRDKAAGRDDPENEIGEILQRDPIIFLLNNLLMTVQFFENFDSDVEILRENWFKEMSLGSHHKRCFYADSLFRLTGTNVKFLPRYGENRDRESLLHPLRIYISSDNVEAAYDPSALGRIKNNVRPQYQLKVQINNKKQEKSGHVFLAEFDTLQPDSVPAPIEPPIPPTHRSSALFHQERKSIFEPRNSRRLTRIEKFVSSQNAEVNLRRRSARYRQIITEEPIPSDGFYNYVQKEDRQCPLPISGFRMNAASPSSHEIPRKCFQEKQFKTSSGSRRLALRGPRKEDSETCVTTAILLNSAAFKGYFCDLLVDKLDRALGIDFQAVTKGSVHEEAVVVRNKGIETHVIPVIGIRDWKNHVDIGRRKRSRGHLTALEWPTYQMERIVRTLPCYAVPSGFSENYEENLDYEKEWKLAFPKAEEFLLLHTMHAHMRCYFFALSVYRSFLEPGINTASLGPKHLLHHLFWIVQKDFLACPEDREGEILLNFFRTFYKRLQNKFLPDFFVNSRNLFANSLVRDLHRAQTELKRILENPLPYVTIALRNLYVETNFYPQFDFNNFNSALTKVEAPPCKAKKRKRKEKEVRFQEDEEKQWKKDAMREMEMERRILENEMQEPIDPVDIGKIMHWDPEDIRRFHEILGILISHFTDMGLQAIKYRSLSEARTYLNQVQRLTQLLAQKVIDQQDLTEIREKVSDFEERFQVFKRTYVMNAPHVVGASKKVNIPQKQPREDPLDTIVIRIVDKEEVEGTNSEEYETKL